MVRVLGDEERVAAGCTGKEQFASHGMAAKVQRRRGKSRDRDLHSGEAYRCPHCHSWHIGERHGFAALRRAFLKKRDEEQYGRL